MSILDRLRRLIASNVNALFEKLGDPGHAIDELIGNMEDAARDARQNVKAALIEDKRAARQIEKLDQSIAEWSARAERAVKAGDDNLAKEALERRASIQAERDEAQAARDKAKTDLAALDSGLRELDAKLGAVKARKETLKTVVRARAQKQKGDSAADRFDRLVQDVDTREAENELDQELNADKAATAGVKQRVERLQTDQDVADRLAAIKEKLGKK
jgi:phage shock protein A